MSIELEHRPLFLPVNGDEPVSLAFIARTRAGKTYLQNEILERYFSRRICVLMTQSPNSNTYKEGFFAKHKDLIKCPDYYPSVIKRMIRLSIGTENAYPWCIILDDVFGKRECPTLKKLHVQGRHQNISVIISGQTCAILNTVCRANTNFIFLGALGNDAEIKNAIEFFLNSTFPSDMKMPDKMRMYKKWTENHQFIVIDNINNEIFITKAKK